MGFEDWKGASVPCPGCGHMLPKASISIGYFRGELFPCMKCGKEVDWFAAILNTLQLGGNVATLLFGLVGAQFGMLVEDYELGRPAMVELSPKLVPPSAEVLDIQYSDEHDELLINEIRPLGASRHGYEDGIVILPVRRDGGQGGKKVRLLLLVAWTEPGGRSLAWQHLTDACREFNSMRYDKVIVPANVAMEISSAQFLAPFFEGVVSRQRTEDFLQTVATYSHQLNVLFPLLAKQRGLPLLRDDIRGKLNELRSRRNELAHNGRPKHPITRKAAGEFIAAALLGYHYLRLASAELAK